MNQDKLNNLKELLINAETILIILAANSNYDQTASASSLYLAIKSLDKDVSLLSPKENKFSNIAGIDQIKTKLGNQNLVVSFDYDEIAVDKVSYHIGEESKKFYLTVKPQKGHKPLDSSSVNFSYTGAEADLVILVGIHDLESLDQLYLGYEALYQDATVVTIHKFEPEEIGSIKLDVSNSLCISEAMVEILASLELNLNPEIATNLLSAIEKVTNSFSSLSTTAETFETVAKLMKAGARRVKRERVKPEIKGRKEIAIKKEKPVHETRVKVEQAKDLRLSQVKQKKSVKPTESKKKQSNYPRQGSLKHQPSSFRS